MTRRATWAALFFAALAMALPFAASAKEKYLGSFGAWRAYTYNQGGQTVCYMVTTKTEASTGPAKRAPPYLMITHRPIEASTDVFSYNAGATLNERRGVKIRVGKKTFDLFSVGDTAWSRDALTDHKIATALRNATIADASGFSTAKGAKSIADRFELSGAPAAYHAIGKACGLPDATTKPGKKAIKKPVLKKRSKPK